jgi:hypothetical protein
VKKKPLVASIVRMTRAERRALAAAARDAGMTIQDFARRRLLAGLVPELPRAAIVPPAESLAK